MQFSEDFNQIIPQKSDKLKTFFKHNVILGRELLWELPSELKALLQGNILHFRFDVGQCCGGEDGNILSGSGWHPAFCASSQHAELFKSCVLSHRAWGRSVIVVSLFKAIATAQSVVTRVTWFETVRSKMAVEAIAQWSVQFPDKN